ncbi:MAG: N-acetylglucosamine kinase [Anaerolineae bacterium]
MSADCYLGIDAGGTKTHALIADDRGRVRGSGVAGPGNWEGVGLEGALSAYRQALNAALNEASLSAGQLAAGGYGLAGYDWPSDDERLRPILRRLGVPGPVALVNDTAVALRAGTEDGVGVVIISGTGTTVAGRNPAGERWRTFGEGEDLGDTGGAGGIARLALRAVAREYTGAGPATILSAILLEHYGADSVIAMLESLARGEARRPGAEFAPRVFAAAESGDSAAAEIIRHVGHEQGLNAAAIIRRLGMEGLSFPVVLAGGVFRARSEELVAAIMEPVRAVAPRAHPRPLHAPPVVGGVLLAMEAAGIVPSAEVQVRLATEARERLG